MGTGWDTWSGNYVEVSHDVARQADSFRTIYMHMRNGASHDCELAWSDSVPTLSGENLTDYTDHLNATGCTEDPGSRSLDPVEWGPESDTVPVQIGDPVPLGAVLGRAGNTGPGVVVQLGACTALLASLVRRRRQSHRGSR